MAPAVAGRGAVAEQLLRRQQAVEGVAQGRVLEGMMVQLRGENSSITTTVYTDEQGRFEFPKLNGGSYTLRPG